MSATRIERVDGADISLAKRTNVPARIVSECPSCGRPHIVDLSEHNYLSYPVVDEPTEVYHHCGGDGGNDRGCDHEWQTSVVLRMSVELVDGAGSVLT